MFGVKFNNDLQAVAWNGKMFITLGMSNERFPSPVVIFTSMDGYVWKRQNDDNWKQKTNPFDIIFCGDRDKLQFTDLLWDGKRLVAFGTLFYMGIPSNSIILNNENGITINESRRIIRASNDSSVTSHILFSEGTYITAGYSGRIETSTNLTDWKEQNKFVPEMDGFKPKILINGNDFCILSTDNHLYKSSDEVNWETFYTQSISVLTLPS